MSTHDDTTPVPAQPGAPAGEPPTTPIPRPGAGRTEEPTLVLDTSTPEPAARTAAQPAAEPGADPHRTGTGTAAGSPAPTEPVRLGKPSGPVASGAPATARTSAFAAVGAPPAGPGTGSSAATATVPPEERPADDRRDVPAAPAAPTAAVVTAEAEISRSLRVGTVVWGLILAIIGAGIIAVAAGARFDLELVAIGLLALAGLALVVGSVVTASRRKR